MERLTLACLQHLPTAVLFVADLTGACGTTVANQWAIRYPNCSCYGNLTNKAGIPNGLVVLWLSCLTL